MNVAYIEIKEKKFSAHINCKFHANIVTNKRKKVLDRLVNVLNNLTSSSQIAAYAGISSLSPPRRTLSTRHTVFGGNYTHDIKYNIV